MCRFPFFYGPAVPGALAPVNATDDMNQPVGVRKCRLYTRGYSTEVNNLDERVTALEEGSSAGSKVYACKFEIPADSISIDCTVEILDKTIFINLPDLTSIIASTQNTATITGLPMTLEVPTTNMVLTVYAGAGLMYYVPVTIAKILNTAMTVYLTDDVVACTTSGGSVSLTSQTKSMYYLQYASYKTITVEKG